MDGSGSKNLFARIRRRLLQIGICSVAGFASSCTHPGYRDEVYPGAQGQYTIKRVPITQAPANANPATPAVVAPPIESPSAAPAVAPAPTTEAEMEPKMDEALKTIRDLWPTLSPSDRAAVLDMTKHLAGREAEPTRAADGRAMHELSIAMSLVDVASEEAEHHSGRVVAVHLKLGPLSGVIKAALLPAYAQASQGSPLAGSRLVIQEMPIIAWCPVCNREREIESMQKICCPICHTPTPELRGGKELELSGLEIVDAEPNANGRSAPQGAEAE